MTSPLKPRLVSSFSLTPLHDLFGNEVVNHEESKYLMLGMNSWFIYVHLGRIKREMEAWSRNKKESKISEA